MKDPELRKIIFGVPEIHASASAEAPDASDELTPSTGSTASPAGNVEANALSCPAHPSTSRKCSHRATEEAVNRDLVLAEQGNLVATRRLMNLAFDTPDFAP